MASFTFVSHAGGSIPLDGSDVGGGVQITVLQGLTGLYEIPSRIVYEQRVGADGARLISKRFSERQFTLRVMFEHGQTVNALAAWRDLYRWFDAGGSIRHDDIAGARWLHGVTLEQVSTPMTGTDLSARQEDVAVLSLSAADPLWAGVADVVESGGFDAPTAWDEAEAWDVALPWAGGASIPLDNPGDAPSWPIVTVDASAGSADMVTFALSGRGGWQTTALDSQVLIVDRSPSWRGPRLDGAGSAVNWSLLLPGAQLFDVPAGLSTLTFGAEGVAGTVTWSLRFQTRWLTP